MVLARRRGAEEAVVDADGRWKSRVGIHPLDDALDALLPLGGEPCARLGLVRALDLHNLAGGVAHHLPRGDNVRKPEPHLAARDEAEEALGRVLAEVLPVDHHRPGEGDLAGAELRALRVDLRLELLDLALRPVGDGELDGIQDRERTQGILLQNLAGAVLEDRHVDVVVRLGYPDPFAEEPQRRRRHPTAADTSDGGHAGVVPAFDVLASHQLDQLPLRQHRVLEVEARELGLARHDRGGYEP
mmetsp:Transcript_21549/g.51867  ORF Transcript_21549/g.51867 Transcript_21549/m.51867 type:complete len:244 (+) Transcript_21549:829-1560(+)